MGKVVDMAGDRVRAEPPGTRLSAPVERRDAPPLPVPVRQRLEILLVSVAAAGQEQQAAARRGRCGPVDPANCVAIGSEPLRFAGIGGNCAAVESRRFRLGPMANSSLLPVVTF